jgi:hypothetical protein
VSNSADVYNQEGTVLSSAGALGKVKAKVLLATRFKDIASFKDVVNIEYEHSFKSDSLVNSTVRLTYPSNGQEIISVLSSGLSQQDLSDGYRGSVWDKMAFVVRSPYAVRNRFNFKEVFHLGRRIGSVYKDGDVSFYDLALASVERIASENAFKVYKDSLEKGYVNTFNHITGQALISALYSVEMADFIADLHELDNMPELTSGFFSEKQLNDSVNFPTDNYVDLINNEIGQLIGSELKSFYQIDHQTIWTPELLSDFMNQIQAYYAWSLDIDMSPFSPNDDLIVAFANKLNIVSTRISEFNRY